MAIPKLSLLFTGTVFAIILMPDFLGAGPVGQPEKDEIVEIAEEKPASSLGLKKLTRSKRNPVAYYRRLPEFWAWYKYYMDTHNQEGIESLDQLYLIYLQNKHRFEGDNSYKHYLSHLSEVYKNCAKSDDPDCIPEYTSKPTAKIALPAAIKQAPVNMCNPYLDPYCIISVGPRAAPEEPPPAPISVKSPSPFLVPTPIQTPSGYHYYAPAMESFLSNEQRAELLRICSPSDVECLQYHLRAAHGYRPALSPVPSYAYLGCDPSKDPYCMPRMLAKSPSGLYHVYPQCNPAVDPLCVRNMAPAAQSADEVPKEPYCNPLFEKGCNPLTANRLVTLKAPVLQYVSPGQLTPLHPAAAMKPFAKSSAMPECHPYDPNCSNFSPPAPFEAAKNIRDGIILPHPDCDPEIDYNCRLRRAEPKDDKKTAEEPKDELESGDDASNANVAPQYQAARFEDFLRGYLGHYKK